MFQLTEKLFRILHREIIAILWKQRAVGYRDDSEGLRHEPDNLSSSFFISSIDDTTFFFHFTPPPQKHSTVICRSEGSKP